MGTCFRALQILILYSIVDNVTETKERSDISCNAENIEIFLPKNLLPVASKVTWLDPNCNIASNSTHYVSTVKHGECGTTVSLTADNVIFENEIRANPLSTTDHLLDFGTKPYTIPVKCIYPRKEMALSSYKPVKQQVRVYEKRFGHLDIDMRQFETDQFSHALDNSTIPKLELNSDTFIKVELQNFGSADLGIHLDTCIATKTPTPYDNMFIKLIENGCPKVNFVHLLPSSALEARFSLRAFEFTSSQSNIVYIHCQASVCLANSSQCNPDCSSSDRTKRDVSSGPSHLLSMGPLVLSVESAPSSNLIANIIAGVSVAFAVIAMVIATKEWRKKRTVVVSDKSLGKIDS
ncbi:pancreatic secretory granule membrane major glycoprotein GP2-like [Saccostrea echinata]|uniref:pancreatic secretory granule membrane major glycoprotein GP2-like n=1 Tax=Saccostrea echinata TaxID=191078 RepID=UPI002A7EC03C|nr:pancreatic secretory granule membrane major glycoprotein GP2-like [Saccostrea echinata]XP_061196475.1 pancreatic secretory granule membrane major glycoprotein GP2-like [Saccostrea echinata]